MRVVWKGVPDPGARLGLRRACGDGGGPAGPVSSVHLALMKEPKLSKQKVLDIAGRTGLDLGRLRRT